MAIKGHFTLQKVPELEPPYRMQLSAISGPFLFKVSVGEFNLSAAEAIDIFLA